MRLFIAILFEPAFKAALSQISSGLRSNSLEGSFVRPENMHLTLAFIGETNRSADIKAAMGGIASPVFDVTLSSRGSFNRRDGLIFWVGLKNNPYLTDLYRQTLSALRQIGLPTEERGFTPHITLGRRLTLRPGTSDIPVPNISMQVKKVSLMKSESIAGKLTYTEIHQQNFILY